MISVQPADDDRVQLWAHAVQSGQFQHRPGPGCGPTCPQPQIGPRDLSQGGCIWRRRRARPPRPPAGSDPPSETPRSPFPSRLRRAGGQGGRAGGWQAGGEKCRKVFDQGLIKRTPPPPSFTTVPPPPPPPLRSVGAVQVDTLTVRPPSALPRSRRVALAIARRMPPQCPGPCRPSRPRDRVPAR